MRKLSPIVALFALAVIGRTTFGQCGVRTWTHGPEVPALQGHAIAFDSLRNRVISFGGNNNDIGQFLEQTWSFDGTVWTQLHTQDSPPGSELDQNLAYDSARDRVVKYAGFGQQYYQRETWEFDGVNWERRAIGGPPMYSGFAMAYDAARQRTLIFSGLTNNGYSNQTWLWDGTTWSNANPATSPPARRYPMITYDAARQRVVMYGGSNAINGQALNDLWEWDGTNWAQIILPGGPPGAVAGGMVFDSIRNHIHLNGNSAQGIVDWIYNGTSWQQLAPFPNVQCGTNGANRTIVFFPNRDQIVTTDPSDSLTQFPSRSYVFGEISAPTCTDHPIDDTVRPGSSIEVGARFTCTPGTTYRWYHNGVALNDFTSGASAIYGALTPTLTIAGPTVSTSRSGEYWCVANSPCGPVTSDRAMISVSCEPADFDYDCGPSDAVFTLDTPLGQVTIPVSILGRLRLRYDPDCAGPNATLSVVEMDLRTEPAIVQVPLAFGGSLTMNSARLRLGGPDGDAGYPSMPQQDSPWDRGFSQSEVEPAFTGLLNYNLLGLQSNYNLANLPPTLLNLDGDQLRRYGDTINLPFNGGWEIPVNPDLTLSLSMVTRLTGVRAEPCLVDIGAAGGVPGRDGLLDNNDFIVFITYFFESNGLADMGVAGGLAGSDGLFDNNDFIAFIDGFFTGCD